MSKNIHLTARFLDPGGEASAAGRGLRTNVEVHELTVVHRPLPVGDERGNVVEAFLLSANATASN
jgi:hypothetical protein